MATVIRTEKYKRGPFGWIFKLLFIGWNILMLVWMVLGIKAMDSAPVATSEAGQAGHTLGMGLGMMMILVFWALGAAILGMLSYFTRGQKVIVETTAG